jgi:hypothetical protein
MKGCLTFILVVQTTIALGLFVLAETTPVPIDIPVGGWVIRLGADTAEAPQAPEATITPLPTLTPTPRPKATATAVPTPTATVVVRTAALAVPPTATVVVPTPTPAPTQDPILGEMKVYLAGAAGLIAAACVVGGLLCWRLLRREPEVVEIAYDPEDERLSEWQEPGYAG